MSEVQFADLRQALSLAPALYYSPVRVACALTCRGCFFHPFTRGSTGLELSLNQGLTVTQLQASGPLSWYGRSFRPQAVVESLRLSTLLGGHTAERLDFVDLLSSDLPLSEQISALPMFDYMVIPEFWNWLDFKQQQQLVKLIADNLKLGGVLFISYYTGLHGSMSPAVFRMSGAGQERVHELVAKFTRNNPDLLEESPGLDVLLDHWSRIDPGAIGQHEFHISSFNVVHSMLSEAGLDYACTADLSDWQIGAAKLSKLKDLPFVLQEEVKDYLLMRELRCDLYVKGLCPATNEEIRQSLSNLQLLPTTSPYIKSSALSPEARALLNEFLNEKNKPEHHLSSYQPSDFKVPSDNLKLCIRTLSELVGTGSLLPCQSVEESERLAEQCVRLNHRLLEAYRQMPRPSGLTLCSPVSGGAVTLSTEDLIALYCYKAAGDTGITPDKLAQKIQSELQRRGIQLREEGEDRKLQFKEFAQGFLAGRWLLEALQLGQILGA